MFSNTLYPSNIGERGKPFAALAHLEIGHEFMDKYGRKWLRSGKCVEIKNIDGDILVMCHEEGFMTERQILKMFAEPGETGEGAVLKRMHLLKRMGFLTEMKLKDAAASFFLTSGVGLKLLRETYCIGDSVDSVPAMIPFGFYSEHGSKLTDVRIAFARRAGLTTWTCKRLLKRSEPKIVVPDGLAHGEDNIIWVIKLELVLKTAEHYRDYFSKLSSAYQNVEGVLCVIGNESRLEWIMEQVAEYKNVYFISLKGLLNPVEGAAENSLEFKNALNEKCLLIKRKGNSPSDLPPNFLNIDSVEKQAPRKLMTNDEEPTQFFD
ncbi:MAG: hypothetical protein Q8P45_00960 [Candidatus Harrisonbacteria bacterium]|nr:hypothetical protein [Candidatus Harrisonbacteria bacterium]